ncbi:MAG: DNA polymerase III subunit delta' [Natronospirillum sp.]|uniref:DNA polymerase III subunit delta' n=1 Tax=Natronospirillum sp. TaxID=2812955 RepID=UPI0025EB046F|nr:DNA polymerase III subunit delta' [Natronospirillum sp.]MCH8551027.1 DNA polymerase III subunit delta' [Natronospirillum sp.]
MIGLPWLEDAGAQLRQQYRQQRLPHGLLLSGGAGLGVDRFVQWLEAVLLCQHAEQAPCGTCHSCELRLAGNHADSLTLSPEGKGQQIKVDMVRELVGFSQGRPQHSHNKVVVLKSADRLNMAAANALLKVLEEPPAGTYLVLQTEEPAQLLPTIRSRLQWFRCPVPAAQEGLAWLQGQGLTAEQAELALALSDQQPCRALEMADDSYLELRETCLNQLLGQLEKPRRDLQGPETLSRQEPKVVLDIWRPWLADLATLVQTGDTGRVRNRDQVAQLQALVARYPQPALWMQIHDDAEALREQVASGNNLNWQLLLEQFWLSIPKIMKRAQQE